MIFKYLFYFIWGIINKYCECHSFLCVFFALSNVEPRCFLKVHFQILFIYWNDQKSSQNMFMALSFIFELLLKWKLQSSKRLALLAYYMHLLAHWSTHFFLKIKFVITPTSLTHFVQPGCIQNVLHPLRGLHCCDFEMQINISYKSQNLFHGVWIKTFDIKLNK